MLPTQPPGARPSPAWRRVSFWVLFAAGAVWGAVAGSFLVGTGVLVSAPLPETWLGWLAQDALEGAARAASRTQRGASATVWAVWGATGLLAAVVGSRWLRPREVGSPAEGDAP